MIAERATVFWLNVLSIHQAALIAAVAECAPGRVTVIAPEAVSTGRRRLGWPIPDFGGAAVVIAPTADQIGKLLSGANGNTVHIVTGWKRLSFAADPVRVLRKQQRRYGFYAEAANFLGWQGRLRGYRDRLKCAAWGRRIDFVLAVSEIGVRWYQQAGFSSDKVFPFAYFVDGDRSVAPQGARGDVAEIAYVGQLIGRKGVDVLLNALAPIRGLPWRLEILGDGPDRRSLERRAMRLALADKVTFSGARPYRCVMAALGVKDLLVLPSRRDGWGVVVNEALMQGVPVCCTEYCGARDLLRDPWRGTVVSPGSAEALTWALRRHIEQGPLSSDRRRRIVEWSQCITGQAAAKYLLAILEHVYDGAPRPPMPWACAAATSA
jgi:glycosyltransferase involved in cell wall biosynthesis